MALLKLLLGAAGIALAAAIILRCGAGAVLATFAAAGIGILWTSLFHLVPMLSNSRAWQRLFPGDERPSLMFLLWALWVRESVDGVLPAARIGGELVAGRVMVKRGMAADAVGASLVMDITTSLASQSAFTLLGLWLAFLRLRDGELLRTGALAVIIALMLMAAFLAVQRFGLFGLAARLAMTVAGNRLKPLLSAAAPIDRAVLRLHRRRGAIVSCGFWQLAAWIAGAGETWIALRFLGSPLGFADALVVEALVQAATSISFFVPAALGVQEGGFLLTGEMVGLTPEVALALALMRRAREVILYLPGIIALGLVAGFREAL